MERGTSEIAVGHVVGGILGYARISWENGGENFGDWCENTWKIDRENCTALVSGEKSGENCRTFVKGTV